MFAIGLGFGVVWYSGNDRSFGRFRVKPGMTEGVKPNVIKLMEHLSTNHDLQASSLRCCSYTGWKPVRQRPSSSLHLMTLGASPE